MTDLTAAASFLWWITLLATTGIILYDLAEIEFAKRSIVRPTRRRKQRNEGTGRDEFESLANSIRQNVETSNTGFQKEAAQVILTVALAVKGSPMTKLPKSRLDEMLDQLIPESALKQFVRKHYAQNPQKIARKNLRKEIEQTNLMLTTAERLFS